MFSKEKIKSIFHLFGRKTLPLYDSTYISQTPAVFIGGCGRSGTTLVRIMLGEHSKIFSGPEFNVHANLIHALEDRFRFLPKKSYLLYDENILRDIAEKFSLSVDAVKKIRDSSKCLAHFMDRLFSEISQKNHKSFWLEKTPKNVTILPFLFRYFPRAKFIHVIRDGRDVACSLRNHPAHIWKDGAKVPSGINRSIGECVKRWVHDVSLGFIHKTNPNYFEIKYEDLVQNPEIVLKKVCEFLEIPFEISMLAYHKNIEKKNEVKHFLPSANAVEKLNENQIGRWKKDLSFEEAKLVEKRAGTLLKKLDYTPGPKWLLWYKK